MRRLGRRGRILKWTGLALSLLTAVAWAVSQPWGWVYQRQTYVSDPLFLAVETRRGILWVNYCCDVVVSKGGDCVIPQQQMVWYTVFREPDLGSYSPGQFTRPGAQIAPFVGFHTNSRGWYISLPLWMPFLLCAIPTVLLWWLDRRRIPPGHCQKCGYDLTGNVSGVCPECGEKASVQ